MSLAPQMGLTEIVSVHSPLLVPFLLLECVAFVIFVVVLVRTFRVLVVKGRPVLDADTHQRIRLRLVVCKRIALALGLIVLVEGYEVAVILLSSMSMLASSRDPSGLMAQLTYSSLLPIFFGILTMSFGLLQYFILDTMLQYRIAAQARTNASAEPKEV